MMMKPDIENEYLTFLPSYSLISYWCPPLSKANPYLEGKGARHCHPQETAFWGTEPAGGRTRGADRGHQQSPHAHSQLFCWFVGYFDLIGGPKGYLKANAIQNRRTTFTTTNKYIGLTHAHAKAPRNWGGGRGAYSVKLAFVLQKYFFLTQVCLQSYFYILKSPKCLTTSSRCVNSTKAAHNRLLESLNKRTQQAAKPSDHTLSPSHALSQLSIGIKFSHCFHSLLR